MTEHICIDSCSRNAAERCRVVVQQRNASYYAANRQHVLDTAAARRRYAGNIVAVYEASQQELSK